MARSTRSTSIRQPARRRNASRRSFLAWIRGRLRTCRLHCLAIGAADRSLGQAWQTPPPPAEHSIKRVGLRIGMEAQSRTKPYSRNWATLALWRPALRRATRKWLSGSRRATRARCSATLTSPSLLAATHLGIAKSPAICHPARFGPGSGSARRAPGRIQRDFGLIGYYNGTDYVIYDPSFGNSKVGRWESYMADSISHCYVPIENVWRGRADTKAAGWSARWEKYVNYGLSATIDWSPVP
jgi:hypothetical protein